MKIAKSIINNEYGALYKDHLGSILCLDNSAIIDNNNAKRSILYNDSLYELYQSLSSYSSITMLIPKSFNLMDNTNEDIVVVSRNPYGFELTKYSFLGDSAESLKYSMKMDSDVDSCKDKNSCEYYMTKVFKTYSFDKNDLLEYMEKAGDSFNESIIGDFHNDFSFYSFLNKHMDSEVKTGVYRKDGVTIGKIYTRIMDAEIPSTGFLATDMENLNKLYDYEDTFIEDNETTLYELVNNLSFNNNKSK